MARRFGLDATRAKLTPSICQSTIGTEGSVDKSRQRIFSGVKGPSFTGLPIGLAAGEDSGDRLRSPRRSSNSSEPTRCNPFWLGRGEGGRRQTAELQGGDAVGRVKALNLGPAL